MVWASVVAGRRDASTDPRCQREPPLPAVCSVCSDACPNPGMVATSGHANDCEETSPVGPQSFSETNLNMIQHGLHSQWRSREEDGEGQAMGIAFRNIPSRFLSFYSRIIILLSVLSLWPRDEQQNVQHQTESINICF